MNSWHWVDDSPGLVMEVGHCRPKAMPRRLAIGSIAGERSNRELTLSRKVAMAAVPKPETLDPTLRRRPRWLPIRPKPRNGSETGGPGDLLFLIYRPLLNIKTLMSIVGKDDLFSYMSKSCPSLAQRTRIHSKTRCSLLRKTNRSAADRVVWRRELR
jgi:hypothetical protein